MVFKKNAKLTKSGLVSERIQPNHEQNQEQLTSKKT